jgi:hypothetical protein
MKLIITFLTVCGLVAAQSSQAPNPVQQSTEQCGPGPWLDADLSGYRGSPNHEGDQLQPPQRIHRDRFPRNRALPEARGEATVESKQGVIKIDARMEKLQPATKFGPEYLTYVMWAITPRAAPPTLAKCS